MTSSSPRRPSSEQAGLRVRGSRSSRASALSALGLVALLGLTACGAGSGDDAAAPGSSTSGTTASQHASAAPEVSVTPAADTAMVNPVDPVVVTASGGELTDVTVTAAGTGETAKGSLDENRGEWRSTEPLAFNERYTVSYTARNGDQQRTGRAPSPRWTPRTRRT